MAFSCVMLGIQNSAENAAPKKIMRYQPTDQHSGILIRVHAIKQLHGNNVYACEQFLEEFLKVISIREKMGAYVGRAVAEKRIEESMIHNVFFNLVIKLVI